MRFLLIRQHEDAAALGTDGKMIRVNSPQEVTGLSNDSLITSLLTKITSLEELSILGYSLSISRILNIIFRKS